MSLDLEPFTFEDQCTNTKHHFPVTRAQCECGEFTRADKELIKPVAHDETLAMLDGLIAGMQKSTNDLVKLRRDLERDWS